MNTSTTVMTENKEQNDYSGWVLIVGCFCVVFALIGLFNGWSANDSRPVLSWLLGLTFWISIGVGMLFLTMLFYVFKAKWAIIVRRQLEHCLSAFPLLAILFLPLLIVSWVGDHPGIIWKWMDPNFLLASGDTVAQDVLYSKKESFLNIEFFTIRAVIYFGVFCGLSFLLRKCSFTMDKDGDPKWAGLGLKVSAIGIPLMAFAATFAAIDWLKSTEYHWFSTMYGVWFFAGSIRAALSTTFIICAILATKGYLKGIYKQGHRYQISCLMLAFTVFWAYITFCQYFLIYNANIPEETFWYNLREFNAGGTGYGKNSWWWVGIALIFGHFLMPFLYMLSYKHKVAIKWTIPVAVWILCFHLLDLYYNILPKLVAEPSMPMGYEVTTFSPVIYDLFAVVGIGCICAWAFLKSMKTTEPIPIRDPRILESVNHHQ